MMSYDWLQWSGYLIGSGQNSLPDMECPEGYRLELLEGNNVFRYRGILYDCLGTKLLTMLFVPKSHLIQYNLITFQIANSQLYDQSNIDRVISLSAQCFIYQFATFSRIDIAVDFELNYKRRNIIKGIYYHRIKIGGKRQGSIFWSKVDGDEFPHDFNFGSIASNYKWKLYNKSLELNVGDDEKVQKPYIIDAWMQNSMNIYKIWRLEVSINDFTKFFVGNMPSGIDKHGNVDYTRRRLSLEDISDLMMHNIMCDLYENKFVLKKDGHTRMYNNERVYLFELEKHKVICKADTKSETESPDNSVMHHLIKVIESDDAKCNTDMMVSTCDALFSYVKYRGLDNLFIKYKNMDVEQWCRMMIDNVGVGIVNNL